MKDGGILNSQKGKDERLLGVKLTPYSNRLGRAGCTVGRCQGGFKNRHTTIDSQKE